MTDDTRTLIVEGQHGRDNGKRFRIREVSPVHMTGYVLRLLSALRLSGVDELLSLFEQTQTKPTAGEIDIDALGSLLRLLTGCDPAAVQKLIEDALAHVEVAADPQHPGTFRALRIEDVQEMKTLADVLGGFARTNILAG